MWPFKSSKRQGSPSGAETRVVDDRVFVLGLDELYRDAMKGHERGELRGCAERLAARLGVPPAEVPVEGYYGEDEALTAYFRSFRALQGVPKERRTEVSKTPDYERLFAVATSPIYGVAVPNRYLLYGGRDPLTQALISTRPPYEVTALVEKSARFAEKDDDISLVGLAARARDPVLLAAVRESVVLYAEKLMTGFPATPEYLWRVSPELERHGARFIETFRALFPSTPPGHFAAPGPAAAEHYWDACKRNDFVGRCVQLAETDMDPIEYYHWAIRREGESLNVEAFWSRDVWTTERYRRKLQHEAAGVET
jgi:hypothetical protein